jgi:hypothetical protein
VTLGQRIAGGLLLVNVVLVLLSFAILPTSLNTGLFSASGMTLGLAIVDLIVGLALLSGRKSVLAWVAIVRVVLGLIVLTALQATQDPFLAVMQLAVSSSYLLLLIGNASTPRMAFGGTIFGVYAVISLVGLGSTATGIRSTAELLQTLSGQIEHAPAGVVTGVSSHYRLHAPSERWHLLKPAAAKRHNALADRWLTRPDLDAHVLVVAEKMPGKRILADPLADAVIANSKLKATKFELLEREPLRTHPQAGRLIHTRTTTSGLEIEGLTGTVAIYEHGYQIVAFAPRKSYPELEAELRSIVESFELPTDERPGVPEDVDPKPAGRVQGQSQPYAITAPSKRWHLRKDEAAKKDNELADRWLARPDEDAHIVVIAEYVPNAVVDVDRYADVITDMIETKMHGTVESREVLEANPKLGRVLHVKATPNGLPLEYCYGLFARGERAFQVIAFTHQEAFPRLKDDFMKAIETFEMP